MTTLPLLRASILKAFSTGFRKFLSKAAAIDSFSSTLFCVCTLCRYTLMLSQLSCSKMGWVAICPATKSCVLLVAAIRFDSRYVWAKAESGISQ